MPLALNIGKCSLLGNYRENNEDSIEVKQFPDLIVSIVADGMGGQAAGEIASKRAIEIIPRELRKNLTAGLNPEGVKSVIKRAIVQANEEIMAMGALDKEMKNMGTTVVMAIWRKGSDMYIAGVGDSRCYLVRDGAISQLTTDHSLAQALVEAKTISAAEAKEHRFKNVLWKYLGSKEVGDGPESRSSRSSPTTASCSARTASPASSRTSGCRRSWTARRTCRPAPKAWANSPWTAAAATTSRAS